MKSMRPLFALCFFFETLYYINLGQRLELGEAFGMGRSLGVARVIRIACLVAWVWRGGGNCLRTQRTGCWHGKYIPARGPGWI